MRKQYHIDKLASNYIELSWDIFNMCNYDCSYCYMKEKPDDWLKIANWQRQLHIIEQLQYSKRPLSVMLLGGEPTLFPKFNEFVDQLYQSLQKNGHTNRLTVITNNTYPEKLLAIPKRTAKDVELNLSYHSEEVDDDKFLTNLDLLIAHKFAKITVTVLMHFSDRYWTKIKDMIARLKTKAVVIEPSYLSLNRKMLKYPPEFNTFVADVQQMITEERKYVFEQDGAVETYGEFDLITPIQDGQTKFKNWDCYIDRYIINIDCLITKSCVEELVTIEDIMALDSVNPTTCPYDVCTLNCHLSFKKCEKNS
jgi:organic radical activating enzyme